MADKHFGFVARSPNSTFKVKRTFDKKAARDFMADIARADIARKQANAAQIRAAAMLAATTVIPIGFGLGALV
jgi:hypothetical protein